MNQLRRAEGLALGLAEAPSSGTACEGLADERPTSTRFRFGVGSKPPVSSRRSLSHSCLLVCFFDPCRPGGCNVWLGLARGFLLGLKVWLWVWLEAFHGRPRGLGGSWEVSGRVLGGPDLRGLEIPERPLKTLSEGL